MRSGRRRAAIVLGAAGLLAAAVLALEPTGWSGPQRPEVESRDAGLSTGAAAEPARPQLSSAAETPSASASLPPPVRPTAEEAAWIASAVVGFDSLSRSSRFAVIGRLAMLGPKAHAAVPALIAALQTDDLPMRQTVASSLAAVGAAAVPALLVATTDADERVRAGAALALGRPSGPVSEEVIAALSRCLRDPSDEVRAAAAHAIWHAGGALTADFIAATKDPSPDVRVAASTSLVAAYGSPSAPTVVAALATRASDESEKEKVRTAAISSISVFGAHAASAVPVLARAARGDAILVSQEALTTLHRLGSFAEGAIPDLLALARGDDDHRAVLAGRALIHIAPADARVLLLLDLWLSTDHLDRASISIQGLVWAGASGIAILRRAAADPSKAALFDGDRVGLPEGRNVTTSRTEVIRSLAGLVRAEEPVLQVLALRSIASIHPMSRDPISAHVVAECLDAVVWRARAPSAKEVRLAAVEALVEIGKGSVAAVAATVLRLGDEDTTVRTRAAGGLGVMDVRTRDVALALAERLSSDAQWEVRAAAADSLARFGRDAKPAESVIRSAAQADPHVQVQRVAALAVRRLDLDPYRSWE